MTKLLAKLKAQSLLTLTKLFKRVQDSCQHQEDELIHAPQFTPRCTVFRSFIVISLDEASLLGVPLLPGKKLDDLLSGHCSDLSCATDRLKLIESHNALILLRTCFYAPEIQHILRYTPSLDKPCLRTYDILLRTGLSTITNCDLFDLQRLQAYPR